MASIIYYPNSSNIATFTWSDNEAVVVHFKSGTPYFSKTPIPKSVIVEWIAAESAGKFFHERIKGVYELEKVQDERREHFE